MNNIKHLETICLKRPPKIEILCQSNEDNLPDYKPPLSNLIFLSDLKKYEMSREIDLDPQTNNVVMIGKIDEYNKSRIKDNEKQWIKSVINIKRRLPVKKNVSKDKAIIKSNVKRQKSENIILNPLKNVNIEHKKTMSTINEKESLIPKLNPSRNKLERLIATNYPFLVFPKKTNSYIPRYMNPIINLNAVKKVKKLQEDELPKIVGMSLCNFSNHRNSKEMGKTISSFHLTERNDQNCNINSFNKPILSIIENNIKRKSTKITKDKMTVKDKVTIFSKKSNKFL